MDRHLGHHTDCVVLSAANRAAFQGYVHELLSAGHHAEAAAAWDSVFEVVHRPWVGPVVELPPLRPMRIVVCTNTDCIRCREGRSGFVFPFLGPWSRRRVIVAQGLDPETAWEAYSHNEATMDRILIAMYSSGWQVPDFCPPIWDSTMARASTQLGGAATEEMLTAWRTWQFGVPRWISPVASPVPSRQEGRTNARHRAQRALVAWLSISSDGSQQRLPVIALPVGSLPCPDTVLPAPTLWSPYQSGLPLPIDGGASDCCWWWCLERGVTADQHQPQGGSLQSNVPRTTMSLCPWKSPRDHHLGSVLQPHPLPIQLWRWSPRRGWELGDRHTIWSTRRISPGLLPLRKLQFWREGIVWQKRGSRQEHARRPRCYPWLQRWLHLWIQDQPSHLSFGSEPNPKPGVSWKESRFGFERTPVIPRRRLIVGSLPSPKFLPPSERWNRKAWWRVDFNVSGNNHASVWASSW